MRIKIGLLLLFIGCLSCERALNVTLPYEGNKFVIFGEFSQQDVIKVQVERTFPPTGEVTFSNDYLNTVKVTLIEDNQVIEVLKRVENSTTFLSTQLYKPKVGRIYQIRVEAPDFVTAESEPQLIPLPLKISSFAFADKEVSSPLNQKTPTKLLVIEFEKPSTNGTYFVAEINALYKGKMMFTNIISDMTIPEFGSPCAYTFNSRRQIFNGDCFNKETNKLNFFVELEGTAEVLPDNFERRTIEGLNIKLSSTSRFYLDFYSNLSPTEGIFKAFESSRPTVTNIKNGYGAVLAKNEFSVVYYPKLKK